MFCKFNQYIFVLAVLMYFVGTISGDLKTTLQQIKDELTEIKQEMREEHITTRNKSLQGNHAALQNCIMIRIATVILTHAHT